MGVEKVVVGAERCCVLWGGYDKEGGERGRGTSGLGAWWGGVGLGGEEERRGTPQDIEVGGMGKGARGRGLSGRGRELKVRWGWCAERG